MQELLEIRLLGPFEVYNSQTETTEIHYLRHLRHLARVAISSDNIWPISPLNSGGNSFDEASSPDRSRGGPGGHGGGHVSNRRGQQPAPAAAAGSPLDSLYFRSIGPASMSGRISDVAVFEANPAVFYVGTAHGGVWKTTNNGTTFEAQLQDQGLMSIGDVAVSQINPDLVWVGTGESNNRQSTSWGDGVYKSTDGGKTWTNMGLKTSRHINRMVIDPRNNDTVFVAATGALFGPGGERGVYKTTDAGKTWKQVLKVDDRHRRQRHRHGPLRQQGPLRQHVSASSHDLLHERRRTGQRDLEVDRRAARPGRGSRAARSTSRSAASRWTSIAVVRTCSTRSSRVLPRRGGRGAAGEGAPGGGCRRRAAQGGSAAVAARSIRMTQPGSIAPTTPAQPGGR